MGGGQPADGDAALGEPRLASASTASDGPATTDSAGPLTAARERSRREVPAPPPRGAATASMAPAGSSSMSRARAGDQAQARPRGRGRRPGRRPCTRPGCSRARARGPDAPLHPGAGPGRLDGEEGRLGDRRCGRAGAGSRRGPPRRGAARMSARRAAGFGLRAGAGGDRASRRSSPCSGSRTSAARSSSRAEHGLVAVEPERHARVVVAEAGEQEGDRAARPCPGRCPAAAADRASAGPRAASSRLAADQRAAVREGAAPGLERVGHVGEVRLRDAPRASRPGVGRRLQRRRGPRREDEELPGARRARGRALAGASSRMHVDVRAADAEGADAGPPRARRSAASPGAARC